MYIPNYGEKGCSGAAIDLICMQVHFGLVSYMHAAEITARITNTLYVGS